MNKLPLVFGLFLASSMALVVFLLSLLAKVSLVTLVSRSLTVFFVFGILGAATGTLLEIILMKKSIAVAKDDLAKELKLEDDKIEQNLGDLLSSNKITAGAKGKNGNGSNGTNGFKPAVFQQLTVAEDGKVVKRGDSAIAS